MSSSVTESRLLGPIRVRVKYRVRVRITVRVTVTVRVMVTKLLNLLVYP